MQSYGSGVIAFRTSLVPKLNSRLCVDFIRDDVNSGKSTCRHFIERNSLKLLIGPAIGASAVDFKCRAFKKLANEIAASSASVMFSGVAMLRKRCPEPTSSARYKSAIAIS